MLTTINPYLLLFISVFVTLVYTIFRNNLSKKRQFGGPDLYLLNTVMNLVSFFILLCLAEGMLSISAYTILWAGAFGIVTAAAAVLNMHALKNGPLSYTTLILTFSSLIPTLSGRIFWGESISILQYFGIFLMLISIVLSIIKEKNDSMNKKWRLYCLCAFLCNGAVGLIQKIHQSSPHSFELTAFLLVAFGFASIVSMAVFLISKNVKAKRSRMPVWNISIWFMVIISGVFIVAANYINLHLSGQLQSAVFFPIVNGGGLVLAILAASLLFQEKLALQQKVGLLTGIVAVLFLGSAGV